MIIAPISGESGPLGALEVYSAEAGAFDDADAARHPLARLPGRDRDPERPADRGAGPLPRGDRPAGRHGAQPPRDRRPDHRDPRARRSPPARRRGGRPAARLGRRDHRPARPGHRHGSRWATTRRVSAERRLRWRETCVGEDVVRRSLAERATLFTPDYLDDPRFGHTADQNKKARAVGLRSAGDRAARLGARRARDADRLLRPARASSRRPTPTSSASSPTRPRSR